MIVPVPVALQVGLVVFMLVTDEILKRKSVMAGDEINAGNRIAPAFFEQVSRAVYAPGKFTGLSGVAAPVTPDGVPVLVVPFGPFNRKTTEMIAAWTRIPGLCNQLGPLQFRRNANAREQRMFPAETLGGAAQNCGQIETESVDTHVPVPIGQAVEHQVLHPGMV